MFVRAFSYAKASCVCSSMTVQICMLVGAFANHKRRYALCVCLSSSVCLYFCLHASHASSLCTSVNMHTCVSMRLSVCLSTWVWLFVCVRQSVCVRVCCLFTSVFPRALSVCLRALSVCLPASVCVPCLSIYISVSVRVSARVCLSVFTCVSVCLSA